MKSNYKIKTVILEMMDKAVNVYSTIKKLQKQTIISKICNYSSEGTFYLEA